MSRRHTVVEEYVLEAMCTRLQQPRRAWGDSWVKVALGAALIVAALAAWLW